MGTISTAIELQDRVSNSLNRINNNIDRTTNAFGMADKASNQLENSFRKLTGAIAGFISVKGAFDFGRSAMEAFNTQTNAEIQLLTVLSNRVEDVGDAFDKLSKKASSIQASGIYGDEAMLGAAAEFSTYFTDTDAMAVMMDTLSNYAMGMSGGGEVSYEQMVNYATGLGKIMSGSYDAMTKKGFEFTEAQKKVIENGTEMEAALTISEVINESWANLYETMSNTPEGKIIRMKNAWGDMTEVVGDKLYTAVGNVADRVLESWDTIQGVIDRASGVMVSVIDGIASLIGFINDVNSKIEENRETLEPLLTFAVTFLGIMGAVVIAYNAWTTAQAILNAVMSLNPIFFTASAIAVVISAIIFLINQYNNLGNTASTTFGRITGGINVVIQFFVHLWNTVRGIAENIEIAFTNAWSNTQAGFYEFVSGVIKGIVWIGEALNKLPFVEFDLAGLQSAADDYAGKASDLYGNMQAYNSDWSDFNSGWVAEAFEKGAKWGDDKFTKLTNAVGGNTVDPSNFLGTIADNTALTASNTGKTVDISDENLKYLRDMAEQETINRFTTAQITIQQTNNNNVSSETDLDGMIYNFNEGLHQAMLAAVEGA